MTGTSGRAAFAFGKNSRPPIPGMLMSERIRITDALKGAIRRLRKIHREAAGAEVAPKLLAKKHLDIIFVVDDENKETHVLSPAWRRALEISLIASAARYRIPFCSQSAVANELCSTLRR